MSEQPWSWQKALVYSVGFVSFAYVAVKVPSVVTAVVVGAIVALFMWLA